MRKKDTLDVMCSAVAVVMDGLALFGGFFLAAWIRLGSGWISQTYEAPDDWGRMYLLGSLFAAFLNLLVFRSMGLFVRPQTGSFLNKIPRLIRANVVGIVLTMVLAFSVQNEAEYSRLVIGLALLTNTFLVTLERYILFRIEWNLARHSRVFSRVFILGTDTVAAHVMRTLKRAPQLRTRVTGFLRTNLDEADPGVPRDLIRGTIEELERFIKEDEVDQVILTGSSLSHEQIVALILLCEQQVVTFNMVPDLFRIMTSSMDVQSLDDIPLLGISAWPLDNFWNRLMKRATDIVGSTLGLMFAGPVILIAGCVAKRSSPGSMFYVQERCGEGGAIFNLYKLRTMRADAEKETGPVWTQEDDPRRTRIGGFLRRWNLDELPQLWNVLRGDMSLVGPRPERPHFVEQFKGDIGRYMWRHVSKPGLTGWAQVNGLRGNTSIEERIKYDLYYLENWSLALDLKILLKTLFARENAY